MLYIVTWARDPLAHPLVLLDRAIPVYIFHILSRERARHPVETFADTLRSYTVPTLGSIGFMFPCVFKSSRLRSSGRLQPTQNDLDGCSLSILIQSTRERQLTPPLFLPPRSPPHTHLSMPQGHIATPLQVYILRVRRDTCLPPTMRVVN